jgi:cytochrome c556|tara:strand:+ start:813 stop:1226 length:414 start_codon:yes stop_codon:yes gene_type:complete
MFKLILIFFLLAQTLLYANPISDRQELMRDYNKLMRAANNLIRENEINDDLASIYEEIEEIMRVYPTLFPDDSFGGKSKASTDIIDNRELFNQIAKETENSAALAKLSAQEGEFENVMQFHQNLFGSCKSCHSRFKN